MRGKESAGHLNEGHVTEHHPPALPSLVHLPHVGLQMGTDLHNNPISSQVIAETFQSAEHLVFYSVS